MVALSPLLVRATRGLVPDVVVLLALGCVIGPSVLDLAATDRAAAEAEVGRMCEQLLANTVIESWRAEIL